MSANAWCALCNAGTIGLVAHGKSTVVKAISGVQTVRFKNELERNITIKLGYANAKIYKAKDPRVPRLTLLSSAVCLCQPAITGTGDSLFARVGLELTYAFAGQPATKHTAAARRTCRPATTLGMST